MATKTKVAGGSRLRVVLSLPDGNYGISTVVEALQSIEAAFGFALWLDELADRRQTGTRSTVPGRISVRSPGGADEPLWELVDLEPANALIERHSYSPIRVIKLSLESPLELVLAVSGGTGALLAVLRFVTALPSGLRIRKAHADIELSRARLYNAMVEAAVKELATEETGYTPDLVRSGIALKDLGWVKRLALLDPKVEILDPEET